MEKLIAERLNLNISNVVAVLDLLKDGATIPFIARYRKEAHNSLTEVDIEKIDIEYKRLTELKARKKTIFERLEELQINKPDLIDKIEACWNSKTLEDLYLPYKPKRRTKASIAKENGLEPLAKIIMAQKQNDIAHQAFRFAKNGLNDLEALEGARHIIAEWVSEHIYAKNVLRKQYQRTALIISKVIEKKKEEAEKYKDYFDFSQLARYIPSHRLLAILRAEKEALLKIKIDIDKEEALQKLNKIFVKSNGEAAQQITLAVKDALKRLLVPSLENELLKEAKEKADEEAISIFAKNLNQLLLTAPLGQKRILALDPGFRTGCKLVCLNRQGNLNFHTTIYPHPPQNKTSHAKTVILELIEKHEIKAIAIGNGTAGRETQQFVKEILPKDSPIELYLISEAGASIYSASAVGRQEFPDLDLTVRGSISIGRRLIDPLAELVKIEPKSIGVGQYQHDVAQDKLKASLDNVVTFAVNKVGVNLNTASKHLLQYVAGVGPKLAQNIVDYRSDNGNYASRKDLLKVKGFGKKAFEQAAGFLRIKKGDNPLDASAVHPERYKLVEKIARQNNSKIEAIIGNTHIFDSIDLNAYVTDKVGLPTLTDIISELKKPGLDPRGKAKAVKFDDKIKTINDINVGMTLTGIVTNLTKFGAFVDIGIKENGLIHKSKIADRFIDDPSEVLKLNQEVSVKVLEVDLKRKRIQLENLER